MTRRAGSASGGGVGHSPVICLVGPTASGKTELAIIVARQLRGEIISADSRQIYRDLSVGTAQPTPAQRQRALFHVTGFLPPDEQYSAGIFSRQARAAINDIHGRNRTVIITAGTGLYLTALLEGLSPVPAVDPAVKKALLDELAAQGPSALHRMLAAIDPQTARDTHPNHTSRIIRALAIFRTTGRPISYWHTLPRKGSMPEACIYGLRWKRGELNERIAARASSMLNNGMIDEVKQLLKKGFSCQCPALKALGYTEVISLLNNELTLAETRASIIRRTRLYAKRQMTWFRAMRGVTWLDISSETTMDELSRAIIKHLADQTSSIST